VADGPMKKVQEIKTKLFKFDNLAQYSPSSYYLSITGVKAITGIPSSATILSVNVAGWSGLGTAVGVGMNTSDGIYVFFSNGWTVSSASYITVQFAYVV